MKCPDHDLEARDACSGCGRALCAQCPNQGAPPRCQQCTIDQLMVPTRRQVDARFGLLLLKVLAVLLAAALLFAAGCAACLDSLSKSIHT